LEGYRQVRPAQVPTKLENEGWVLGSIAPGFQVTHCTRRALDPVDASAAPAPVLQAVFSDGLTHVSLFIEPYDRERHKRQWLTQVGATHTLMQRHGTHWWVTIIGDVPAGTLKQFHQALERRR
jgi:sigma-E factor negative regulatory protein RseB